MPCRSRKHAAPARADDRGSPWASEFASRAALLLGRRPSDAEAQQFSKYLLLLQKWQRSQRLVGSADAEWIVSHIFLDSLLFLALLPAGPARIADLGSGAGVPGIPLRIVRPELDVTMVEARQRRASFLSHVVRELGFANCQVLNRRAESLVHELGGTFDAVVARCAGNPAAIARIGLALVRPGGSVIISGPPEQMAVEIGEWRELSAPDVAGGRRRFLVAVRDQ